MLEDLFLRLVLPLFEPLYPQARFYWAYLASAALIALGVLYFRQAPGTRSWRRACEQVFAKHVFLHPSALLDLRFAAVNHILFAFGLGLLVTSVATMTDAVVALLRWSFGAAGPGWTAGPGASIAFTILAMMAVDAGNFVGHWLQHRLPVLWAFHKVHHSAEVLTPLTAIRVHPVSEIFGTIVVAAFAGLANGAFLYLYRGPVAEITVLGVSALYFLFHTIGATHLAHSHVWVMFPKGLREVFLSPALHMIHHSRDRRHHDKNFAFGLTLWDRLAGTLYMPGEEERDRLSLGLDEADQRRLSTVRQLYVTPFHEAFAHLAPPTAGFGRKQAEGAAVPPAGVGPDEAIGRPA